MSVDFWSLLVWAWVVGAWSLVIAVIDFQLFHAEEEMSWVGMAFALIFFLVLTFTGVYYAVHGSIEFLRYMEAWPFIPQ